MESTLREDIIKVVQDILDEVHTDKEKRTLDNHKEKQLEMACPCCGDSNKNTSKKRGILYLDSFKYYCWNGDCDAKYWSIFKFFKRFGKHLSNMDQIKEISEVIAKSKRLRKPTKLIDSSEYFEFLYDNSIDIETLSKHYGLLDVNACSWGKKYLQGRLLHKFTDRFLFRKNKFGNREVWILNKIDENDKVVGAQIKNLDFSVKYITKSFATLHEEMGTNLQFANQESEEKCVNFSTIFNIFNVDIEDTLTVFEGPIDSFFMRNSIATAGASKLKNFFDDLDNVRFFFDNDKTGKSSAIEKIKKNVSCFLWKRFFINTEFSNKRVKDLNELIVYINEHRESKSALREIKNSFSSSKYDIYHV
jgi:hypothetical protein